MNLIHFIFHPHLTKLLRYNRFKKYISFFIHIGTYVFIVLDNVSYNLAKIGQIPFIHVMNKAIQKEISYAIPLNITTALKKPFAILTLQRSLRVTDEKKKNIQCYRSYIFWSSNAKLHPKSISLP